MPLTTVKTPNVSATSRQLVTARSQSRLGLTTSRSRLGLGRKRLVHIPAINRRQFHTCVHLVARRAADDAVVFYVVTVDRR